ncbi:hypothetical protein [Pseudooctadecabacter sp.]|uniref:hypothetical protein n=1 Tax=Pseudooctadecabacter sp. TaxID=1966338 RepID=UPI0035C84CBD
MRTPVFAFVFGLMAAGSASAETILLSAVDDPAAQPTAVVMAQRERASSLSTLFDLEAALVLDAERAKLLAGAPVAGVFERQASFDLLGAAPRTVFD